MSEIETETVSIEMELEVRIPKEDGSFSFDPLAQTIGEGSIPAEDGEIPVKSKITRLRCDGETSPDILTKFGTIPDGAGVFLNSGQIAVAAKEAVEECESVELPEPEEDNE